MDSNAAGLFEVGVEMGLGDANVSACVVAGEATGGVAGSRVVEGDVEGGGCLLVGILTDTR